MLTMSRQASLMEVEGATPHRRAAVPEARSEPAIWLPMVPTKVLGCPLPFPKGGVISDMVSCPTHWLEIEAAIIVSAIRSSFLIVLSDTGAKKDAMLVI